MKSPILLALLVGACSHSDGSDPAPDASQRTVCTDVKVSIISAPDPTVPVGSALTVFGSVSSPNRDVTVYGVTVGPTPANGGHVVGVAGSNTGFDFSSWTASVPLDVLRAGDGSGSGLVTLSAEAISNCRQDGDSAISLSSAPFTVALGSNALKLGKPIYPAATTYVPVATGSASVIDTAAIIPISANAAFANSKVVLTASLGTVTPTSVTLDSNGSASATFSSASAGTAEIAGVLGSQTAVTFVNVIGAPTLLPFGGLLRANDTFAVTVFDPGGQVSSCAGSAGSAAALVASWRNAIVGPGGISVGSDADGLVHLVVTSGSNAKPGDALTLSCQDVFAQQSGSATFVVGP